MSRAMRRSKEDVKTFNESRTMLIKERDELAKKNGKTVKEIMALIRIISDLNRYTAPRRDKVEPPSEEDKSLDALVEEAKIQNEISHNTGNIEKITSGTVGEGGVVNPTGIPDNDNK